MRHAATHYIALALRMGAASKTMRAAFTLELIVCCPIWRVSPTLLQVSSSSDAVPVVTSSWYQYLLQQQQGRGGRKKDNGDENEST